MGSPEIAHVIVPLDSSTFAERALPVAAWLAGLTGATIDVVAVASTPLEEEELKTYLATLTERITEVPASMLLHLDDDSADRIVATELELAPSVVVMASHGRGRSAALLGSVASRVIASGGDPVLLVGREARVGTAAGTVVACVDGSSEGEDVVPVAAAWSMLLDTALDVVTVAEPVPEPMTPGEPYRRRHGPQIDAERYVSDLALQVSSSQPGLAVQGHAVYDPIGPTDGLISWLAEHPAQLLVVGARSHSRLARAVVGSTTSALVRASVVPVLALRRL